MLLDVATTGSLQLRAVRRTADRSVRQRRVTDFTLLLLYWCSSLACLIRLPASQVQYNTHRGDTEHKNVWGNGVVVAPEFRCNTT